MYTEQHMHNSVLPRHCRERYSFHNDAIFNQIKIQSIML